jgi:hypothetical protein
MVGKTGTRLIDYRMEKETNNLQKEAKTYLDAMRGGFLRQFGPPLMSGRDGIRTDSYSGDHIVVLLCRQSQRCESSYLQSHGLILIGRYGGPCVQSCGR